MTGIRAGIDLGFYQVKVNILENQREKQAVFLSAVGDQYTHSVNISSNGRAIMLDKPYPVVVGEAAVMYAANAQRPEEDREWVSTRLFDTLWLAALSELATAPRVQGKVVVGLPIRFYEGLRTQVRNRLAGVKELQRQGRPAQEFDLEVGVVVQPLGTLYDAVFDDRGYVVRHELLQNHVGIIGIGGGTTNFLHAYQAKDVPNETTHINVGGWEVVRRVGEYLDQYNLDLHDYEIAQIIEQGFFKYGREHVGLSSVISEAREGLASAIENKVKTLWPNRQMFESILVSGGGALGIGKQLAARLPNVQVVADPIGANARGYRKAANRNG